MTFRWMTSPAYSLLDLARAAVDRIDQLMVGVRNAGGSMSDGQLSAVHEECVRLGWALDDFEATHPIAAASTREQAKDTVVQQVLRPSLTGGLDPKYLRTDPYRGDTTGLESSPSHPFIVPR